MDFIIYLLITVTIYCVIEIVRIMNKINEIISKVNEIEKKQNNSI
jgi:hypothetical protein